MYLTKSVPYEVKRDNRPVRDFSNSEGFTNRSLDRDQIFVVLQPQQPKWGQFYRQLDDGLGVEILTAEFKTRSVVDDSNDLFELPWATASGSYRTGFFFKNISRDFDSFLWIIKNAWKSSERSPLEQSLTVANAVEPAEMITKARKTLGLSMSDLADVYHVARNTLYHYLEHPETKVGNIDRFHLVDEIVDRLHAISSRPYGASAKNYKVEGTSLLEELKKNEINKDLVESIGNSIAHKLHISAEKDRSLDKWQKLESEKTVLSLTLRSR